MSNLLFSEPPLVIQPTIAKAIGLNESIVLQQIHYWMGKSSVGQMIDGVKWIYNSLSDWKENFPFWSESTIYRTLQSLEDKKIIKTGCFNKRKGDKTKWFTIDYGVFSSIMDGGVETPSSQNGTPSSQDGTTLPETTAQNTHSSDVPSETSIDEDWNNLQRALDTDTELSPYAEALNIICDQEKILSRDRFKKDHKSKMETLLGRDPTRAAFQDAIISFRQSIVDGKVFATPDYFLGFYATAIDTLAIRAPYALQKQEFQTPTKTVVYSDNYEF